MSNKTTKVKLNESHLNEIRQMMSRIDDSYDPLYNEARELRNRFKTHMYILMDLRIFAQKYGTLAMVQKMNNVYQKIDKIDNELYNITDKILIIKSKHDDLEDLFKKYENFCKK